MIINALYKKYFQKSKIFLYPLLDIKRGTSVVPEETYLAWDNKLTPEDMKLVCVYYTRTDAEYTNFEKNVLLKHSRLCDYVKHEEKSVFTFDFSDLESDWFHLVYGRYSKVSDNIKRKILGFFDTKTGNYVYVTSYLYPAKHFKTYADLLGVSEEMLKAVGELCDKPDLEKENLLLEVANLENIEKTVNL